MKNRMQFYLERQRFINHEMIQKVCPSDIATWSHSFTIIIPI